jgi:predicted amidophosphoribosyltransferase
MESEMICDSCRKKTYSLNQFLGKMVCSKCYHELVSTIQIPKASI